MDFVSIVFLLVPLLMLYGYEPGPLSQFPDLWFKAWQIAILTIIILALIYVYHIIINKLRTGSIRYRYGKVWQALGYGVMGVLFVWYYTCVFELGWVEEFDRNLFPVDTFLIADICLLLPVLLPLVLHQSLNARTEQALRGIYETLPTCLWRQTRVTLVLLGPQLLYLNTFNLLANDIPITSHILQKYPWASFLLVIALLLIVFSLAPYFVRYLFARIPLENLPDSADLVAEVRGLASKAGVRIRSVTVWLTKERALANAAVSGLGRQRTVFITDHLMRILSTTETAAVIAHEFGHAKHRHMLMNLFLALGTGVFVLVSVLLLDLVIGMPRDILPVFVIILQIAYLVFVFGFVSRRFELQADTYAAWLIGKPTALADALLKLAREHRMSLNDRSITHPSIEARVKRLLSLDRNYPGNLYAAVRKDKFTNALILTLEILAIAGLAAFVALGGDSILTF